MLSDQNQLIYNYFKQLFAQVTNPPLDAIREELVTSLGAFAGSEQNLFDETPAHCRQLQLRSPIIGDLELAKIKELDREGLRSATLAALYDREAGDGALKKALSRLRRQCAGVSSNRFCSLPAKAPNNDKLVMASETGVLDVPPAEVKFKGRL